MSSITSSGVNQATVAEITAGSAVAKYVSPDLLKYSPASGLGVNQSWQNVTSSRSLNVTYTNSTGKSICIAYSGHYGDTHASVFYINGVAVESFNNSYGFDNANYNIIIPNGATYKITDTSFVKWWELR